VDRRLVAVIGVLALVGGSAEALEAQGDLLYDPGAASGDAIIPFFDGWVQNPDGTYALLFGFINPNTQEAVTIPLGENNFIEPKEFDGMQPTYFPIVSYGGDTGRRERGVFGITVPADFRGRDVVWTLRRRGKTVSVPGRVTVQGYALSHGPQSEGSMRPRITFDPGGPGVIGPAVAVAGRRTTRAGQPLTLSVWGEDRGNRPATVLEMVWFKHQGPGAVTFSPANGVFSNEPLGTASTTATFSTPGEYMVRVRVGNLKASDSGLAEMCCWTNGFVPVTVTP
jgi:hypothetical protein